MSNKKSKLQNALELIGAAVLVLLFMVAMSINSAKAVDVCYEPYGGPVEPEYVVDQVLVQIIWVEGERGLETESSFSYDEEINTGICIIWVRMPDEILGDSDMDSIGHEFLHCATGDFHAHTPDE